MPGNSLSVSLLIVGAFTVVVGLSLLLVGGRQEAQPTRSDVRDSEPTTNSEPAATDGISSANAIGDLSRVHVSRQAIRMCVSMTNGEPVLGARIEIRSVASCVSQPPAVTAQTNAQGTADVELTLPAQVMALSPNVGVSKVIVLDEDYDASGVVSLVLYPGSYLTLREDEVGVCEPIVSVECCSRNDSTLQATPCAVDISVGKHWHVMLPASDSCIVLAECGGCVVATWQGETECGVVNDGVMRGPQGALILSRLSGEFEGVATLALMGVDGRVTVLTQSKVLQLHECSIPSGQYWVTAQSATMRAYIPEGVALGDPCGVSTIDLNLDVQQQLEGRAVWTSGDAACNVRVIASQSLGPNNTSVKASVVVDEAQTDERGDFSVGVTAGDVCDLQFSYWHDGIEESHEFVGEQRVPGRKEYVLGRSRCDAMLVAGDVVDVNTGFPTDLFETRLAKSDGPVPQSVNNWSPPINWTGNGGGFFYSGLDPASQYFLQVRKVGSAQWDANLGPLMPGRGTCDLSVALGAPGEIVATVQSGDLLAYPVTVYIRRAGQRELDNFSKPLKEVELSSGTECAFDSLASGWYWLCARDASDQWGATNVFIRSAARTRGVVDIHGMGGYGSVEIIAPMPDGDMNDPGELEIRWRRMGRDLGWGDALPLKSILWQRDGDVLRSSMLIERVPRGEYEIKVWSGGRCIGMSQVVVLRDSRSTVRF